MSDDAEFVNEVYYDDDETPEVEHADFAAGLRELDELARQAELLAAQRDVEHGTDLVPVAGRSAEDRHALMLTKRDEINRVREVVKAKTKEMEAKMRAEIERVQATLAPLREQVAEMEQGIVALEGYLGIGEGIDLLRDGDPAPADATIWVRQMVLGMDEECAVTADGGIDARSIDEFVKWLLDDPTHLQQIAPESKCVVALRPRRNPKDYGEIEPLLKMARDAADASTFLLIRNGDVLYLHTPAAFDAGNLLVPAPAEFEELFTTRRYDHATGRDEVVRLQPGTWEWEHAEEKADKRRRYYMRGALVLEGLLHRTAVFHPVPEGASFIQTESYEAGITGVILDAVNALGHGLESWPEYQSRLLGELRPGMRILAHVHNKGRYTRDASNYVTDDGRGVSFHPSNAEDPPDGPLLIEEMDKHGNPIIRYARTETIWANDDRYGRRGYRYEENRLPKTRASVKIGRKDRGIIPLDLIDPADIDRFLRSRLEREHYLGMFPLLKEARRIKLEEAETEAPFRLMLTGILATRNAVDVATVEADLDDLIEWHKLGRRDFRPLVGNDPAEHVAVVDAITAEYARRLADRAKPVRHALVETLAAMPDTLLVARKRDGKYVRLSRTEGSDVHVTQTEYGARGAQSGDARPWLFVGRRTRQWQVLWTGPEWETWPIFASPAKNPTGPQLDEMRELALDTATSTRRYRDGDETERHSPVLAVTYMPKENRVEVYRLHTHAGRSGWEGDEHRSWIAEVGELDVRYFDWKADATGKVTLVPGYGTNHRSWDRETWRPKAARTEKVAMSLSREVPADTHLVLYEADDATIDAAQSWTARVAAQDNARSKAHGARANAQQRLVESIAEQIEAAHWERAFEKFMERYKDAGLWEEHRKVMPGPKEALHALISGPLGRLVTEGGWRDSPRPELVRNASGRLVGDVAAARGMLDSVSESYREYRFCTLDDETLAALDTPPPSTEPHPYYFPLTPDDIDAEDDDD